MNGESFRVLFVGKKNPQNKKIIEYLGSKSHFQIECVLPRKVRKLRESEKRTVDLVLLDLRDVLLPGTPLKELLAAIEKLQQVCQQAEFVLFNNRSLDNVDPVIQAGVFRCLPWNMQPSSIAQHLLQAIEIRNMRQKAYERNVLAQLLKNNTLASEGRDLDTVLDSILRSIQSVGFDRARLYLTADNGRYFYGRAQVGMSPSHEAQFLRLYIEKESHPYLTLLQPTTHAQVYSRPNAVDKMPYDDELDNHELTEWVYLPLIYQKNVMGLIVADNRHSQDPLIANTLEPLALFAQQVASAINNATFLKTIERQKEQLEQLHKSSLKISSQQTRQQLLNSIVDEAVKLLKAKSGGIYEYDPRSETLTIVADHDRSQTLVGQTLKKGEGMAGRLVNGSKSHLFTDNYNEWPHRVPTFKAPYPWEAVLEVPLRWEKKTLGVIYVDDHIGRNFSLADANLLRLFSDQAAIAMLNTQANGAPPHLQRQLVHFSQLGNEFIGRLSGTKPEDTLSLLCQYTTRILQAEGCELFLAVKPGTLRLEARYGSYTSRFKKGFKIQPKKKNASGFTSRIVQHRSVVRLSGVDLIQSLSVAEKQVVPAQSQAIYASIGLPLIVQQNGKDVLLGILRADNKLDNDGRSAPKFAFTEEDEWLLQLLGNFAVVAIESSEQVRKANSQVANYEHLFASSPSGVVANDHNGEVVFFSRRAEELLGYTQKEALGIPVTQLFKNVDDAYQVGLAVRSQENLIPYQQSVEVVHKEGHTLSLSLSANKLLDAQGEHIGYVGYFEDQRELVNTRERYRLLLDLSNTLSRSESLQSGLEQLAEQMIHLFDAAFCRIFLVDPTEQVLNTEAVAFADGNIERKASWKVATRISDWAWAKINLLLHEKESSLILANGRLSKKILAEWSKVLGLDTPISSLLEVPIRTKDRIIGLLDLGDFHLWSKQNITKEKRDFVISVANQAAAYIDRMQSHEALDQRNKLLTKLDEMTNQIRAIREPSRVLAEVVRLAVELAGCEMGALFINDPASGTLLLMHSYKMPESLLGQRVERSEGVIGQVVRTGKLSIENKYQERQDQEAILSALSLETVAGFPIMRLDEVNGVLMVADTSSLHWIQADEQEALERFARHATAVLRASQLFDNRERLLEQLDIIRRISEFIQETPDFNKQLHIMVTAVTARFGLRFNRAALFLYDEDRALLHGSRGIGHLHPEETRRSWQTDAALGKDQFLSYKQLLETDAILPMPIENHIQELHLPVQSTDDDLFSQVIHKQTHLEVTEHILYQLPESFVEAFAPTIPAIIVPLKVQNQVLGLLVVDNHVYQESITPARIKSLLALTNACAIAIKNGRLFAETEQARRRLNALYQAGKTLVSSREPREVWQAMITQLHQITSAKQVRMLLIDKERGAAQDLFIAGKKASATPSAIRKDGYSLKIMRTGLPQIIEDANAENSDVNPTFFERNIGAAVGLPVILYGETIGVVWIYYKQPVRLLKNELEDYQVYVNNSALAYDRAQRIKDLDSLSKSAEILARPVSILATSKDIVKQATQLLVGDSAALWAYDNGSDKFILDECVAYNIPDELWQSFKRTEPKPKQLAYTVLKDEYIEIKHIMDPQYDFISESTYQNLTKANVNSLQGVLLAIGAEKLGVLYLNRHQPGSFSSREVELIKTFAQQAALALKNARLMEQANKAREAARLVANKITISEDGLDEKLQSVVQGIKDALKAHAVVLYPYKEETGQFNYPPTMKGVWEPHKAKRLDHIKRNSIAYTVLNSETPIIVDNVQDHPLFYNLRFAIEEKVRSCLALPLRVGDSRVGVLFVNYRTLHRFQSEEILDIKLLANQAAFAIHAAQLLAREQLQKQTIESINIAAHAVTTSLNLEDFLEAIVQETHRLFKNQSRDLSHASIWLIENESDVRIVSDPPVSEPTSPLYDKKTLLNWAKGVSGKRIGVTGRTLRSRKPVIVNDVSKHPDYIASHSATKSELAVPIIYDDDVVGAINVEGANENMFTEPDVEMLKLLARQTAVAISNARHLQSVNTLHNVATKLSGSLDLQDVISHVMLAALTLVHADAASLIFWDEKTEKFTDAYQFLASKNRLEPYKTTARSRNGLTRQIVDSGTSITKNNTDQLPNLNPTITQKNRKSLIGTPIKTQNSVIAVLYVSSHRSRTFIHKHQKLLEALVGQSAMAIDRVRHYEELQKTKRIVGSYTALAWMGMTSSRWRHRIEQHAIGIQNSVFLLKDNLIPKLQANDNLTYLGNKLTDIDQLAQKILDHDITPPLGSNAEEIFINELIRERVTQLWQNIPYSEIGSPFLGLEETHNKKVKSSIDWLRLALDNLVDNALEAMRENETAVPQLWITTRQRGTMLDILIRDNGPGMPQDVLDELNSPSMEPKVEDGSLGRGLLMVQAIVDAYNGHFTVLHSGKEGTTVVMTLPTMSQA